MPPVGTIAGSGEVPYTKNTGEIKSYPPAVPKRDDRERGWVGYVGKLREYPLLLLLILCPEIAKTSHLTILTVPDRV